MDFTIFYAWQSDSPRHTNSNFVQDAIDKAIRQIQRNPTIELSPRADRDTRGLAGSPAIADAILEKIKASGIVVGDLTLVGMDMTGVNVADIVCEWIKSGFSAELGDLIHAKKIPNPNVLLEVGHAADAIGWERVILVMNTQYGKPEELPFDLRHRRFPITYALAPDASTDDRESMKTALIARLVIAFTAACAAEHAAVETALSALDIYSLIIISSYRDSNEFRDLGQEPVREHALRNVITVAQFHLATLRLLDLKLIRTHVQGVTYAYRWTYLGTLVIAKLNIPAVMPNP